MIDFVMSMILSFPVEGVLPKLRIIRMPLKSKTKKPEADALVKNLANNLLDRY